MIFLWFVILVVVAMVLHRVRQSIHWEQLNVEDRAKLRAAIDADPKNIGAYELLGDSLRQSGRLEDACEWYKRALRFDVDETNRQVRYKLERAQKDIERRKAAFLGIPQSWKLNTRIASEVLFCRRCGTPNPPYRARCEVCEDLLMRDSYLEAVRELWNEGSLGKFALIAALNSLFLSVLLALIFKLPTLESASIGVAAFVAITIVLMQRLNGNV